MLDFSILVGATKLGFSLGGKPAVLSCQRGLVQVINARNGQILIAGPVTELRFTLARTSMVSIASRDVALNVFGYDRYTPATTQLIAERRLPPLVGAAQAATWFPDAFRPEGEFLTGTTNVTALLPRLLAANGVRVNPR